MRYSILNSLFNRPKKIVYKVESSSEFTDFCRDSHLSEQYPGNSDEIRRLYTETYQTTTLLTGDYIEIKWPLTPEFEPWMMWMVLKGYNLTVK